MYASSVPGAGIVTSTVTGPEGFNAYGVQIRFQATDFVSTSTASSSSSSVTTTSSTTRSTSTGSSDKGLSTGTTAGIGVGVSIAGILILVGVIFFFLRQRRRRRRRRTENISPGGPHYQQRDPYYSKPELADTQKFQSYQPSHLVPPSEPVELGTGRE